jgi:monofunctional biosynthetic peptidoglycan transglycosylase
VYLNMVEWGNGVFGAEAAAQHYYRMSAAQLGPTQSANLAVMLPNPRHYEKNLPNWVRAHARKVQARMGYSQIPK